MSLHDSMSLYHVDIAFTMWWYVFMLHCAQKSIAGMSHGASSGGSTPDLSSLQRTAASVDDLGALSEKFCQQAACGQSQWCL